LGKFIPKITNFGDFAGCISPHFLMIFRVHDNGKFGVRVRTWDTLPTLDFVKKIA